MIQLEMFPIHDENASSVPSEFAKTFLYLIRGDYADPLFARTIREQLYKFTQTCSNKERKEYCKWIHCHSLGYNIDIGRSNWDTCQRCIDHDGDVNYL